jgi:hypothetical protein
MERVVAAERVGIDRVRVTLAGTDGEHVVDEARFVIDRLGRHLSWESTGLGGYGGELEVTGVGEVAWVRVRAFTEVHDPTAEADMEAIIANIRVLAAQPPPS